MVYEVICDDCQLDHVWPTEKEARKELGRHIFETQHKAGLIKRGSDYIEYKPIPEVKE